MSEGREGVPVQLAVYRDTIDNLDAALVHLLAERFRCTQQVGLLKASLDLPPADPEREQQQVARLRALAEESGLDPVFAENSSPSSLPRSSSTTKRSVTGTRPSAPVTRGDRSR